MARLFLVFQGIGKTTYVTNHPDAHAVDCDVKDHRSSDDWEKEYFNALKNEMDNPDNKIVFGNISKSIMDRCLNEGIHFTIISPVWNGVVMSDKFICVKERLFGRYVLRHSQKNGYWIEKIKRHYDEWTKEDFFTPYTDAGNILINVCDGNSLTLDQYVPEDK